MKKALLFVTVLFMLGFTYKNYLKQTAIIIKPESNLIIKGKTNLNTFDCSFDVLNLKNPIPVFYTVEKGKMFFKETNLVLENACFDCDNKAMNKDFRELLKTGEHPKIYLRIKELENVNTDKATLMVHLNMEIAGITIPYKVPVKIEAEKENLFVRGKLAVDICDFNLEPPKKLLGIIKVDNEIEVDFQLLLQEC